MAYNYLIKLHVFSYILNCMKAKHILEFNILKFKDQLIKVLRAKNYVQFSQISLVTLNIINSYLDEYV